MALSETTKNKLAYVVISAAAVIGVWFVGHDASEDLKNQINGTVSKLCIEGRPNIIKENALRDAQIEIAEDAKVVNLAEGDGTRASLNDRTITALKAAKRHVPTVEECMQPIIP